MWVAYANRYNPIKVIADYDSECNERHRVANKLKHSIMKMLEKHKSKLHKGFEKQVRRQDAKPYLFELEVKPTILSYDEDEGGYRPLKQTFRNDKWNGMNLKNICNSFQQIMPNWFNSFRSVNKEGNYKLSMRGQQALNRKKKRLNK